MNERNKKRETKKRLKLSSRCSFLTPSYIKKTLEANRHQIRRYSVKKIGLFGSYRKGTPHARSDIDFLIKLADPTFDNYMELKFYLEELFGRKVDLITEETIKPALKHIKEEALYAQGM